MEPNIKQILTFKYFFQEEESAAAETANSAAPDKGILFTILDWLILLQFILKLYSFFPVWLRNFLISAIIWKLILILLKKIWLS